MKFWKYSHCQNKSYLAEIKLKTLSPYKIVFDLIRPILLKIANSAELFTMFMRYPTVWNYPAAIIQPTQSAF